MPENCPHVSVLLMSDEPFLRQGFEAVVLQAGGFTLASPRAADVVLVDMGANTSYATLQELIRTLPHAKVLLWANEVTTEFAYQAMSLGVRGVLRKTMPFELQLDCLRKVAGGELSFDKGLSDRFLMARRVAFSKREGQIICLLTRGYTNKEIATALGVTEGTVKVYLSRLFDKVGVGGRFELALYGLRNLTPDSQQPPPGTRLPDGLRSIVVDTLSKPTGEILSGTVRDWLHEQNAA